MKNKKEKKKRKADKAENKKNKREEVTLGEKLVVAPLMEELLFKNKKEIKMDSVSLEEKVKKSSLGECDSVSLIFLLLALVVSEPIYILY